MLEVTRMYPVCLLSHSSSRREFKSITITVRFSKCQNRLDFSPKTTASSMPQIIGLEADKMLRRRAFSVFILRILHMQPRYSETFRPLSTYFGRRSGITSSMTTSWSTITRLPLKQRRWWISTTSSMCFWPDRTGLALN